MKKIFVVLATILATQSVLAQVYFGRVRVNSMNQQTVWFTNNTMNDIRYNNSFVSGIYFNTFHSCYGILKPHQSCTVQVQYWPSSPGYHSANINMYFTNANGAGMFSRSFNAWGEAVPF